ncbi:helix-turn-helix domain-containing protein [Cobetia crustatorum]|uniref:DnaT DNA-binding domain-containing protein n=1 Tax=Cobetia crustatorum TaxID=553385 RepID=A0A558HG23_9GAMM|nr:helix-turn-helix domain-containing protein [Cobetia crustatorum]TVU68083.1 hypothetical protein FQP86_14930 [Cobetia crustatorum]
MSLQGMAWAREMLPSLPNTMRAHPRLLLLLIADYVNERGVCWPSVRRLANEMACSRSTVQRSIEALVELGLMDVVHRKTQAGRQTSNFYRLAMKAESPAHEQGDEPTDEEIEALMAGSGVAVSEEMALPDHPIFAEAAQQDDRGHQQADTDDARQQAMTLDWVPDASHWQAECLRRGLPDLVWDQAELADFTAHFSDHPGRKHSRHAWCARFTRWVSENRKQQAARQARTDQANAKNNARTAGGSTHASHRAAGPVRNSTLSAAEGRAYLEQQRREAQTGTSMGGDIFEGDWSS